MMLTRVACLERRHARDHRWSAFRRPAITPLVSDLDTEQDFL